MARQVASSVTFSSVDGGSELSAPDTQEPPLTSQSTDIPILGGQTRDNCSAERFFYKLKSLSASSSLQLGLPGSPDLIFDSSYTYLRLKSDFHRESPQSLPATTTSRIVSLIVREACLMRVIRDRDWYQTTPKRAIEPSSRHL